MCLVDTRLRWSYKLLILRNIAYNSLQRYNNDITLTNNNYEKHLNGMMIWHKNYDEFQII